MTLEKKEITIPSWVLTAIVSIVITVVGYAIGSAKVEAQTATEVTHVKEELAKKASIEAVDAINIREDDMQQTLRRIEDKLDRHIEQQKNMR